MASGDYIVPIFALLAVLIGVRNKTWNDTDTGSPFRRITAWGWAAILVGVLSTSLTLWSTYLKKEQQRRLIVAANQEIAEALSNMLSPFWSLYIKFDPEPVMRATKDSNQPRGALDSLLLLSRAVPILRLKEDTFLGFLGQFDARSPSNDIRTGERASYLDSMARSLGEGKEKLEGVLNRYTDLLDLETRESLLALVKNKYVEATIRRPDVLRQPPCVGSQQPRTVLAESRDSQSVVTYTLFIETCASLAKRALAAIPSEVLKAHLP